MLHGYTKDRKSDKAMYTIPQKSGPRITKRLKTPEEIEIYFLGFLAFIDSTEQQIPRPDIYNKRKQKMFYSSKRKRHTVKNQLMVNKDGYILHKVAHKKGRRHDYIFKNIRITIL